MCWNQTVWIKAHRILSAATFGWLCVETLTGYLCQCWQGRSHLRVAVCWNFVLFSQTKMKTRSHLRVAVCWNSSLLFSGLTAPGSHLRVAVCWNNELKIIILIIIEQPPSGGCVLKHLAPYHKRLLIVQPPSGGCVLKPTSSAIWFILSCSHLRVAVCWNARPKTRQSLR